MGLPERSVPAHHNIYLDEIVLEDHQSTTELANVCLVRTGPLYKLRQRLA